MAFPEWISSHKAAVFSLMPLDIHWCCWPEFGCWCVVLLLDSAQDSCPGHLNIEYTWKPILMGFVVIRGLPELQLCVWKGKGHSGDEWQQNIPSSAVWCRCIFSVLEVVSWCPKLLSETRWLIEALVKSFIPKCLFSIHVHQMETAALWLVC